jgi:hypothetical protein
MSTSQKPVFRKRWQETVDDVGPAVVRLAEEVDEEGPED